MVYVPVESEVYKILSDLHVLTTVKHILHNCSATVAAAELHNLLQKNTSFNGTILIRLKLNFLSCWFLNFPAVVGHCTICGKFLFR